VVVSACHTRYAGSITRRIIVQAGPGKKFQSLLKIIKVRRAGGMTQAVEYLLSKN
jgi:hypothetical protein